MAVKAWASQQKPTDEIFFQNEAVSLCMLLNRRARTMRVIDFRAGPTDAKRLFVLSIARREGVEKVFTVVERDEVSTWIKLGFQREGNIPSFYKRSDAFVLGCSVKATSELNGAHVPFESETRIAVAARSLETAASSPSAHDLMEKTVVAAKRIAKELPANPPHGKVTPVTEVEARKALAPLLRAGRALTAFEAFGRDAARRYFTVAARGGFELLASIETQACFGNAFLEAVQGPKNPAETAGMASALRGLCARLLAEQTVSCFSLAPIDDVALGAAFVSSGFRRTGLLSNHMVAGGRRVDAIVWSRKLAVPTEE